jgi:hypothetical protein
MRPVEHLHNKRRFVMSSETSWTSLGNAVEKYGLESSLILKWVDDGLIYAEHHDTRSMRIRVDDLIQKIKQVNKSNHELHDFE